MAYGNYAPFYRPEYFNPMQNMASNQFTQPYQPQQPPIQTPIQQPTQQNTNWNDMIWVLGRTEAESYLVQPNNSVVLWDKNQPTIYIKSVNMQGVPSIRILDFTERSAEPSRNAENSHTEHKCTCGDKFATKEQINVLEGKIDDIVAKYEELSKSIVEKTKSTSKKAKEGEE